MNRRADELAIRFDQATAMLVMLSDAWGSDDWRAMTNDEGWPVGAVVRHIAAGMLFHLDVVLRIGSGKPPRAIPMAMIDEVNRSNADPNAEIDRDEVLAFVRSHSDRASRAIRRLSDAQLDRSSPIPFANDRVMTTDEFITEIMIAHIGWHVTSIKRTLATRSAIS